MHILLLIIKEKKISFRKASEAFRAHYLKKNTIKHGIKQLLTTMKKNFKRKSESHPNEKNF